KGAPPSPISDESPEHSGGSAAPAQPPTPEPAKPHASRDDEQQDRAAAAERERLEQTLAAARTEDAKAKNEQRAAAAADKARSLAEGPVMQPAAGQLHVVQVFFGTDRAVVQQNGKPVFTSQTADALSYGVAEVSIPPKHEVGQVESPEWWRF